jgi:uroporphyrin-3 C-methyltransferase
MSTTEKQTPPAKPKPTPAEKKPGTRSGGIALGLLALALAVAAAAASGYLWYTLQYKQKLLGTDLTGQISGLKTELAALKQSQAAAQDALAGVKTQQQTLTTSLQQLNEQLGKHRNDWMLEEVRQLLLLANHRLKLAGDVDTAVAALKAADGRLEQLSDPRLLDVRKLIAGEITQLETLGRADIPGLALRLAGLAETVDKLPLVTRPHTVESKPAAETTPEKNTVKRVAGQVWHDLLGLVRVRHISAPQPPLLPPEQDYFLRENLRLLLNGAQLALLQRQGTIYRHQLEQTKTWINRYFDPEAPAVKAVVKEVDTMLKVNVTPTMPDISASLEALNKHIKAPAAS